MKLLTSALASALMCLAMASTASAATQIKITTPQAGASYTQGSTVNASYSCLSTTKNVTIRSCTGTVPNGQPISTASTGQLAFRVTAVDSRGRSTSATANYTVSPSGGGTGGGWTGSCANGYVALTYDDGPTTMTRQYVDTLAANGAKATFFMVGNNINARPSDAQYVIQHAMQIQDHTMTHTDLTTLQDFQVDAEIGNQKRLVASLTGFNEWLIRPPYGASNGMVFDISEANGTRETTWSIDTNDWQNPSTSTIASRAGVMHDQDIILMHDGYPNTLNAIVPILNTMKQKALCPGQILPSWDTTIQNPWGWPVYDVVRPF